MKKEEFKIPQILAKDQIQQFTVVKMREETLMSICRTEIILEVLGEKRSSGNNHSNLELVNTINNTEAKLVELEGDLKILDRKLKDFGI